MSFDECKQSGNHHHIKIENISSIFVVNPSLHVQLLTTTGFLFLEFCLFKNVI